MRLCEAISQTLSIQKQISFLTVLLFQMKHVRKVALVTESISDYF